MPFVRSCLMIGLLSVACSSEQFEPAPEQGSGGASAVAAGGATDSAAAGGGASANGGSGGIDPNAGCVCSRNDRNVATLPLECWCAERGCPTEAEVSAPVDTCTAGSSIRGPFVRRGCGVVEYASSTYYHGARYQFDAATGALVAMQIGSDTPGGPCQATMYEIGPFKDCSDFVECVNCLSAGGETTVAPLCSELE